MADQPAPEDDIAPPAEPVDPAASKRKPAGQSLASAAVLMVIATLGARVMGLVRVMVISRFGTTGEINAYIHAFTIPDFVYFLIAGGALRTGFVPVFTEYMTRGRESQAWKTFSSLFFILLIFAGVIITGGIIAAPALTVLIAPGWVETRPDLIRLCSELMRIIFPAQLFFVLGGLFMGTLNAQKHFFWPAMAPIVYDIFIIGGALAVLGSRGALDLQTVAYALVAGALVGHVVLQIAPLIAGGVRLQPVLDLRDEGVKRVVKLVLPVIFGLAVAEINYIVIRTFSTMVSPDQGPAVMEYANRLWKLPAGIFGAAIAIALFPMLSEHYAKDDVKRYRRDFSFGMRNTLFLTVPAALVMGLMPTAVVRLLFERGDFTAGSTAAVSEVMAWFAPGILALSVLYIVARAFYARHDTRTPLIVGIISVAVCALGSYLLMEPMGLTGLALSMTVSNFINAGVLMAILKVRVGQLDGNSMLASQLRCLPANVFLAVVCIVAPGLIASHVGTEGDLAKLVAVVVPLAVGGLGFVGGAAALRVPELASAWRMVARRFGGRKVADASRTTVEVD